MCRASKRSSRCRCPGMAPLSQGPPWPSQRRWQGTGRGRSTSGSSDDNNRTRGPVQFSPCVVAAIPGPRDVGGDAAGASTSSDPEMKRAPGEGRPAHATRNDARNARKFSRDRLLRQVVGIPRSTTSTRSMIATRISARDASGLTSITPYWRYRSTAMAVTGRVERSRCDRRVPNRARVRRRPEWRR